MTFAAVRRSLTVAAATLCLLTSCTTSRTHVRSIAELEEELDRTPLVTHRPIAQIQALRPQLSYPFRLGIAPPSLNEDLVLELGRGGGVREQWEPEEEAVLAAWVDRFRAAGLVSDVVLLSPVLMNSGPANQTLLQRARSAGARQGVDAVLVTQSHSSVTSRSTPLSILDLTIVAGLVVPSHELESKSVIEAVLVDVRNEYVYLAGRGTSEHKRHAALFSLESKARPLAEDAHLAAVEDLSRELMEQAIQAGFESLRQGAGSRAAP